MNKFYLVTTTIVIVAVSALIFWFKPESSTTTQTLESTQKREDNVSINKKIINPKNTTNKKEIATQNSIKGFAMPNTNWPTREINGISYVFGEGNPEEVALDPSEYTGDGKWQDYVTPESEAYLKEFLEDESLKDFVDKCGDKLELTNNNTMPGFNITHSEDLDINKLLLINADTGRKQFDESKVFGISQLFSSVSSTLDGDSALNSCMNSREIESFSKLQDALGKVTKSYINQPTDGFYDQYDPNSPGYDIIQETRERLGIPNKQ